MTGIAPTSSSSHSGRQSEGEGNSLKYNATPVTTAPPSMIAIPSFTVLNPFATAETRESFKRNKAKLIETQESLALRQQIHQCLKNVTQFTSRTELELRANTPEYKVAVESWSKANCLTGSTLKTIGRLPRSLFVEPPQSESSVCEPTIQGWLLKKGENFTRFKRRYMELSEHVLTYYKREPQTDADRKRDAKGTVNLDHVANVLPSSQAGNVPFAIDLVTPSRTWVLAAENEQDYQMWVDAIGNVVSYNVLSSKLRHILKHQQSITSSIVTDVEMVIATNDSVSEIVETILSRYVNSYKNTKLKPFDPKEYLLKVTGFREFFLDRDCPIGNYEYIRTCMLKKETIRLSLIHEDTVSSIQRSTIHFGDLTSQDSVDLDDLVSTEEVLPDEVIFANSSSNTDCFFSSNIHHYVNFRTVRAMDIPTSTLEIPDDPKDKIVRHNPIATNSVRIMAELYVGGSSQPLSTCETPVCGLKRSREGVVGVVFEADCKMELRISQLPLSTRLVLTVYVCSEDGYVKLATAGLQLFDVNSELVQGDVYLRMMNNLHDLREGSLVTSVAPGFPILHLQFPKHTQPIKHQWSDAESFTTTVIPEPFQVFLDRQGWLSKLGSLSKFTKWRKRYFILSQKECIIRYYETYPIKEPKGEIQLRNAQVIPADKLNKKYTNFISKSTGKELQNWCFKVIPEGSSREFILSAQTKQERDEWMHAIFHVATADCNENAASRRKRNMLTEEELDVLWDELMNIVETDPLYRFNVVDATRIWKYRYEFKDYPEVLPRLLKCVNWMSRTQSTEAIELMQIWKPPQHMASYIQLLDCDYGDANVRRFAISQLRTLTPVTLRSFLPQLVQALKFEPYHASELAAFLIEKAIDAPSQLGFELFWCLKVESYDERHQERFTHLLNGYLEVCGRHQRSILELQDKLFSAEGSFARICSVVKARKRDGAAAMKRVLHDELRALNTKLPSAFQLPIDPRIEVGRIIVDKCRVMDSAKLPLWLVFENAEPGGDRVTVMFKSGDDVRQDCLTLQLMRLMDEIWRENGIDLSLEPYRCVATSPDTGILQIVTSSVTIADIQKRYGGNLGPLYKNGIFSAWIVDNNQDERKLKKAKDLYMRSVAGYCVATYVLGIGDRHNDNIMVSSSGRYFHIDFGHFLGNVKYQFGWRRERSGFVFTKEMAHPMGGVPSKGFEKFVRLAGSAYNMIRQYLHLLMSLLSFMIPAQMPELQKSDDLHYVLEALAPNLDEEEAAAKFRTEIMAGLQDRYKAIDDTIHNLAHA